MTMRSITVNLTEVAFRELETIARDLGKTPGQVIRDALRHYSNSTQPRPKSLPTLPIAALEEHRHHPVVTERRERVRARMAAKGQQHGEVEEDAEQWCGECGLKLAADMPMRVWTGHFHTPVAAEVMKAAWTVYAVVEANRLDDEDGDDFDAAGRPHVLRLLERAGITEQAVRMYAASTVPTKGQEGRDADR